MKIIPVLADKIKTEAGFGSFSIFLAVSMPVELLCWEPSGDLSCRLSQRWKSCSGKGPCPPASSTVAFRRRDAQATVWIGEELSEDHLQMGKVDTEERRVRREAKRRRKEMEREQEMLTMGALGIQRRFYHACSRYWDSRFKLEPYFYYCGS